MTMVVNFVESILSISTKVWHRIPKYYTIYPTKNRVSKRMNKKMMDKVRSMFSSVGIAQELWAKVVNMEKCLVNMSASLTLFC
jgi:hypothetical protein